jgi:hypothetical protein
VNAQDWAEMTPDARAEAWDRHSARAVVSNAIYMGDETHEQIVKPWLWKKAQAPEAEKRTVVRGEGHVLGGGLVRCGHCGGGLVKSPSGRGNPNLRCDTRGPGHTAVSYPRAEEFIVSETMRWIGWTAEHSDGNAEEFEAAEARLAEAREELAEVEALRGTVSPAAYAVALSDAQEAVEAAEESLAGIERTDGTTRFLTPLGTREKFEALSVPERRRALHAWIERVVLSPGKGSAQERLTIHFKDGAVVGADAPQPDWAAISAKIQAGIAAKERAA